MLRVYGIMAAGLLPKTTRRDRATAEGLSGMIRCDRGAWQKQKTVREAFKPHALSGNAACVPRHSAREPTTSALRNERPAGTLVTHSIH
jgi:hypothetical protein